MSEHQSNRQLTLDLMLYCQFVVPAVSISKHQFLICPLFACSPCTHNQLLPWHPEKICCWSCPTHAVQYSTVHTHTLECLAKSVSLLECYLLKRGCTVDFASVSSLICGEGKPFGCILRSLRGLQGLVGR